MPYRTLARMDPTKRAAILDDAALAALGPQLAEAAATLGAALGGPARHLPPAARGR